GPDQELGVALHEMRGHRHARPVCEAEVAVAAEFLDAAEDVIPAPGVEPGGVMAQLVQDLVHLEGGDDRLDQHRRPDRPAWNAEPVLRHDEDVVPQPGFEMALELRQVEVRPAAARHELLRVVEEVEREIEDTPRDRASVDDHVLLGKVPAARPNEERRDLLVEPVGPALGRDVVDAAPDRVPEVDLPLNVVLPARRVRVLEIGHEHLRAGVERIDDHLAVDRSGDLDASILDAWRHRIAGPVALAYVTRTVEELR